MWIGISIVFVGGTTGVEYFDVFLGVCLLLVKFVATSLRSLIS